MRVDHLRHTSSDVAELAILIMLTPGGTHIGLLYRSGGRLFVLDQMWHEQFRVAVCDREYACVVPCFLREELNDAAEMCELFVKRLFRAGTPQRVPLGFSQPSNPQIGIDGEIIWGGGAGLTCSTFVLAVFDAARIPYIDISGWVRRDDDDERHNRLLEQMIEGIPGRIPPADPAHVSKVRSELPCIRVRPEETAAAGLFEDRPARFAQVEPAGQWILEQLRLGNPHPAGPP